MRRIWCLAAALLAAGGLAACATDDTSYTPAAFGPPGYCYYLYSPYECYGQHPGMPLLMPLYWHQRYAAYYDSPAYVQHYVPSQYRSTATTSGRAFEQRYSSQIKAQASAATYRSSSGGTVSGSKVSQSATFGSGNARSSGFSSGSARPSSSGPCGYVPSKMLVASTSTLWAKGGSSGGGGFSSGGARSSGSSGSRAGSRSGPC